MTNAVVDYLCSHCVDDGECFEDCDDIKNIKSLLLTQKLMKINEAKKKIVIDNYFKKECDVNTSIKEAFTKGFEIGLKKALTTSQSKMGCEGCIYEKTGNNSTYPCSHCGRCYTDKYKAEKE